MSVHAALEKSATSVTAKMTRLSAGDPEDQLRAPFEEFMKDVAAVLGWKLVCTGNTRLPDRLGIPDYALHLNRLLIGYAELKAPGTGAAAARFKGRNRDQFRRFRLFQTSCTQTATNGRFIATANSSIWRLCVFLEMLHLMARTPSLMGMPTRSKCCCVSFFYGSQSY